MALKKDTRQKAVTRESRSWTSKGEATKERILNAAEQLFAEQGFSQTTIRDIAKKANADLSSMSYHFASKQELFDQAMARPAEVWCKNARDALETTVLRQGDQLTVEDVLLAFADVSFRALEQGDAEWLNYARLATQRMRPTENMNSVLTAYYLPVRKRYLTVLGGVLKDMPASEVEWCFSCFESNFGAMVYGHVNANEIDMLRGKYLEQLRRNFIPFCAGGFDRVNKVYADQSQIKKKGATKRQSKAGSTSGAKANRSAARKSQ